MLSEVLRLYREVREVWSRSKLPEYSGWNISSSPNGDHEIGLKLIKDVFRGCLAEFVDLGLDILATIPV